MSSVSRLATPFESLNTMIQKIKYDIFCPHQVIGKNHENPNHFFTCCVFVDFQEEGWLMGEKENSTEKGLFPANFTRPL